jgi:hypothetical protein
MRKIGMTTLLSLITAFSFQANGYAVSLFPSVFGSIEDSPPDGIGDTIVTSVPGVIDNVSSPPAPIPRDTSAIVEYNVSSFADMPKITAFLDGTIFVNNALDTGERIIDILVFQGDGVLSTSDFQIPATSVGTVSYSPPLDTSVSFSLDITNIVQSLIDGGNSFIGVRFEALNEQAPSQLLSSSPPTLELTTVPEPASTLSLLALGTLGAASTLKRKLKPTKSEKETEKVG